MTNDYDIKLHISLFITLSLNSIFLAIFFHIQNIVMTFPIVFVLTGVPLITLILTVLLEYLGAHIEIKWKRHGGRV